MTHEATISEPIAAYPVLINPSIWKQHIYYLAVTLGQECRRGLAASVAQASRAGSQGAGWVVSLFGPWVGGLPSSHGWHNFHWRTGAHWTPEAASFPGQFMWWQLSPPRPAGESHPPSPLRKSYIMSNHYGSDICSWPQNVTSLRKGHPPLLTCPTG